MKSNYPALPVAILAAVTSKQVGFVVLALDASLNNDGWCQLLPEKRGHDYQVLFFAPSQKHE